MGHKIHEIHMDLSEAFDSVNHELLIAKLKSYRLDRHAADLFRTYQCCKIYNIIGNWRKILAGVQQGSILGPLFFNTFLSDIFFFLKDANLGNRKQQRFVCLQ